MKHLGFGAAAVCLAGGFALAAGGDGKCGGTIETAAETPLIEKADGLIARWKEISARKVEGGEADLAVLAKARDTLSEICPVCKRMPDTIAFLRQTLAVSKGLEKACEASCNGEGAAAIPAEVKRSLKERAGLLSRAHKLFAAAFAAEGEEASVKVCCKGAEKKEGKKACCAEFAKRACGADPDCYAALGKTADGLLAAWEGIPAQVAAFSAEEKVRFQSAMATMRKAEGERFPLFHETILAKRTLLERVLAIGAELEKLCKERMKEDESCPFKGTPLCPENSEACKAFADRNTLLEKTVRLLDRIGKVLSPDPSNPLFAAQGD